MNKTNKKTYDRVIREKWTSFVDSPISAVYFVCFVCLFVVNYIIHQSYQHLS